MNNLITQAIQQIDEDSPDSKRTPFSSEITDPVKAAIADWNRLSSPIDDNVIKFIWLDAYYKLSGYGLNLSSQGRPDIVLLNLKNLTADSLGTDFRFLSHVTAHETGHGLLGESIPHCDPSNANKAYPTYHVMCKGPKTGLPSGPPSNTLEPDYRADKSYIIQADRSSKHWFHTDGIRIKTNAMCPAILP